MKKIYSLLTILALGTAANVWAQQTSPWVLNYFVTEQSCQCHKIGNGFTDQHGSFWNRNQIDLSQPFDFTFKLRMLNENVWNADGCSFILQKDTISYPDVPGTPGQLFIDSSLALEIDIFYNEVLGDIGNDHLAIMANGTIDHNSPGNLAGPVSALLFNQQLTNGQWQNIRITWTPATQQFQVYTGPLAMLMLTYTGDIVNTIFGGNPMVYWGWAGGSGGVPGQFEVCFDQTANFPAPQSGLCAGQELSLTGNATSQLGPITSVIWDMGDGNTTTGTTANYTYSAPGQYTITMMAYDLSGCPATTTRTVTISDLPEADFLVDDVCEGQAVTLTNVTSGASAYQWSLNGTNISTQAQPSITPTQTGTNTLTLTTGTGGCQGTHTQTFEVTPGPVATFTTADHCFGVPVPMNFSDPNSLSGATVSIDYGNATGVGTVGTPYTYPAGGTFEITVSATAGANCTSQATQTVNVWQPEPLINESQGTLSVANGPFTTYQWFRNDTLIASATSAAFTPSQSGNYSVVVTDENGCTATSFIIEFTYIGIDELMGISNLNVFPNPAQGETNVRFNLTNAMPLVWEIADASGRVALQGSYTGGLGVGTINLNVASLSPGMYLLRLSNGNGRSVKPLAVR